MLPCEYQHCFVASVICTGELALHPRGFAHKSHLLLQVWNVNKYSGVVGVFNIQGSTWSRTRRQFIIHDSSPPQLTTAVKPADIPLFSTSRLSPTDTAGKCDGSKDSSQSGSYGDNAAQFAVYCNVTDHMCVMGLQDEVPIALPGELLQAC